MIPFKLCRRFIAFFTVTAFILTQTISPFPSAFAAPVSLRPEVGLVPSFDLSIPADLGTIQYRVSGNGPALVHLQTAHGNYEAQKNIEGILNYLKKHYGFKWVLLEGSAFKLSPELLNFFPHYPENTKAANDELAKTAVVKGPELFLLETQDAEGYGIENLNAYRDNIQAFRTVLKECEKTRIFTRGMSRQIERLTSPYLTKNLRVFVKRLELFEKNQIPFENWLAELKTAALETLKLDLTSAGEQLDWPMLVRLFKLHELSKRITPGTYEKEKAAFLKEIKNVPQDIYRRVESLLSVPLSASPLPDPETGILFENLVRHLPKNFNAAKYPEVTAFTAHLILQSELKSDRLMGEIEKLTDQLAGKMADSSEAKEILALLKDYRLLEKLFALELTPADYEKILARGEALQPKKMAERFLKTNSSKRAKDVQFDHLEEVTELFNKAMDFYRGAKERDAYMLENTVKKMAELKMDKAVVVTGGFHSEPFAHFFSEKKFNYALVTPRITKDEGRSAYLDVILENEKGKVKTSTIETAPASSLPSEFAAMGTGGRFMVSRILPPVLNASEGNASYLSDFQESAFAAAWGTEAGIKTIEGRRGVEVKARPESPLAGVFKTAGIDSEFYPFIGTRVIAKKVPVVSLNHQATGEDKTKHVRAEIREFQIKVGEYRDVEDYRIFVHEINNNNRARVEILQFRRHEKSGAVLTAAEGWAGDGEILRKIFHDSPTAKMIKVFPKQAVIALSRSESGSEQGLKGVGTGLTDKMFPLFSPHYEIGFQWTREGMKIYSRNSVQDSVEDEIVLEELVGINVLPEQNRRQQYELVLSQISSKLSVFLKKMNAFRSNDERNVWILESQDADFIFRLSDDKGMAGATPGQTQTDFGDIRLTSTPGQVRRAESRYSRDFRSLMQYLGAINRVTVPTRGAPSDTPESVVNIGIKAAELEFKLARKFNEQHPEQAQKILAFITAHFRFTKRARMQGDFSLFPVRNLAEIRSNALRDADPEIQNNVGYPAQAFLDELENTTLDDSLTEEALQFIRDNETFLPDFMRRAESRGVTSLLDQIGVSHPAQSAIVTEIRDALNAKPTSLLPKALESADRLAGIAPDGATQELRQMIIEGLRRQSEKMELSKDARARLLEKLEALSASHAAQMPLLTEIREAVTAGNLRAASETAEFLSKRMPDAATQDLDRSIVSAMALPRSEVRSIGDQSLNINYEALYVLGAAAVLGLAIVFNLWRPVHPVKSEPKSAVSQSVSEERAVSVRSEARNMSDRSVGDLYGDWEKFSWGVAGSFAVIAFLYALAHIPAPVQKVEQRPAVTAPVFAERPESARLESREFQILKDTEKPQTRYLALDWTGTTFDKASDQFVPGIRLILERARALGVKVAVITYNKRQDVVNKLAQLGVPVSPEGLIQEVFGIDQAPQGTDLVKTYHLKNILTAENLQPEQVVAIGDAVKDNLEAGRAGVRSVYFNPGNAALNDSEGPMPNAMVADFSNHEFLGYLFGAGARSPEEEKLFQKTQELIRRYKAASPEQKVGIEWQLVNRLGELTARIMSLTAEKMMAGLIQLAEGKSISVQVPVLRETIEELERVGEEFDAIIDALKTDVSVSQDTASAVLRSEAREESPQWRVSSADEWFGAIFAGAVVLLTSILFGAVSAAIAIMVFSVPLGFWALTAMITTAPLVGLAILAAIVSPEHFRSCVWSLAAAGFIGFILAFTPAVIERVTHGTGLLPPHVSIAHSISLSMLGGVFAATVIAAVSVILLGMAGKKLSGFFERSEQTRIEKDQAREQKLRDEIQNRPGQYQQEPPKYQRFRREMRVANPALEGLNADQLGELNQAVSEFQNLFRMPGVQENEIPSQDEILAAIDRTNLNDEYRLKHHLPPTVVFRGEIYKSYKGIPPHRIAMTLGNDFVALTVVHNDLKDFDQYGTWKDASKVAYPLSKDFDLSMLPISKGGVRWYHEGVRPLDGPLTFNQKLVGMVQGTREIPGLLLETTNLSASMLDKSPPADVFFGGGKTVIMTRENAKIENVIDRWVGSSMTAKVLGGLYVAGPDMSTAELMGNIQKAADSIREDMGLLPVPMTTSIEGEKASLNHELWTVTSISAVESFFAAWNDPEIRKRYGLPDGTPESPIDITIQGYGDVGTGIVKYLSENEIYRKMLENGSLRILAVSNKNGGIYGANGLNLKELLRIRDLPSKERETDLFRLYGAQNAALRDGVERIEPGDVYFIREREAGRKALVAFAAAGPNVFNDIKTIERLEKAGVKAVVSPANNSVKENAGLELEFERHGILLQDARLVSAGGIYTSTEEIYHQLTDGMEAIRDAMGDSIEMPSDPYYKWHIQGGIAEISNSVTHWVIERFKALSPKDKTITITAIHQDLAQKIRNLTNRLLQNPSEALLARINRELKRVHVRFEKDSENFTSLQKTDLWNWIARVVILDITTEMARARVMYHPTAELSVNPLNSVDTISGIAARIKNEMLGKMPGQRPDLMTQRALVYDLGRMQDYGFENLFIQILQDESFDSRVRGNAAEALGVLNGREALNVLQGIAQNQPDSYVGVWARWALNKIESHQNSVLQEKVAELVPLLAKRDPLPKTADLIIAAGSSDHAAAYEAAELFKQGLAPKILVTGRYNGEVDSWIEKSKEPAADRQAIKELLIKKGVSPLAITMTPEGIQVTAEAEIYKRILIEQGVPSDVIISEDQSHHMQENAKYSVEVLKNNLPRTAILIHAPKIQARGAQTFRNVFGEKTTIYDHAAAIPDISGMDRAELGIFARQLITEVGRIEQFTPNLPSLAAIKTLRNQILENLDRPGSEQKRLEMRELIWIALTSGLLAVSALGWMAYEWWTSSQRKKDQRVSVLLMELLKTTNLIEWDNRLKELAVLRPEKTVPVKIAIARGIFMTIPVYNELLTDTFKPVLERYIASFAYALAIEFGSDFIAVGSEAAETINPKNIEALLTGDLGDIYANLQAPVRQYRLGVSNYANAGKPIRFISLNEIPENDKIYRPLVSEMTVNPEFPGTYLGVDIGGGSMRFGLIENGVFTALPEGLAKISTIKRDSKGQAVSESGTEFVERISQHVRRIKNETGKKFDGIGIDMPGASDIANNRMATLGQIAETAVFGDEHWGQAQIEEVWQLIPEVTKALGIPVHRGMVRNDMDGVMGGVLKILPQLKADFLKRTGGNFRFDWMGSGHGHQFAVNGRPFPGPTEGGHLFVDSGRPGEKIFDTEAHTSIENLIRLAVQKGFPKDLKGLKPVGDAATDPKSALHQQALEVFDEFARYYARNLILGYQMAERTGGIVNARDVLLGGGITRGGTGEIIRDLTQNELKRLGYEGVFHIEVMTEDEVQSAVADYDDLGVIGSAALIQAKVQEETEEGNRLRPESRADDSNDPEARAILVKQLLSALDGVEESLKRVQQRPLSHGHYPADTLKTYRMLLKATSPERLSSDLLSKVRAFIREKTNFSAEELALIQGLISDINRPAANGGDNQDFAVYRRGVSEEELPLLANDGFMDYVIGKIGLAEGVKRFKKAMRDTWGIKSCAEFLVAHRTAFLLNRPKSGQAYFSQIAQLPQIESVVGEISRAIRMEYRASGMGVSVKSLLSYAEFEKQVVKNRIHAGTPLTVHRVSAAPVQGTFDYMDPDAGVIYLIQDGKYADVFEHQIQLIEVPALRPEAREEENVRSEFRAADETKLLTPEMIAGLTPVSEPVAVSVRTSREFSQSILRVWMADRLLELGEDAVRFIGNMLSLPLRAEAFAAQTAAITPADRWMRVGEGMMPYVLKLMGREGASMTAAQSFQHLSSGRFVYQGDWLQALEKNQEALYNLLDLLARFEKAGLTVPLVAMAVKKEEFIEKAEKTLTRKSDALDLVERNERVRDFIAALKKGRWIQFLQPESQNPQDVEAAIRKFITAGKDQYGVTVFSTGNFVIPGAVNFVLAQDKVRAEYRGSFLSVMPIGGVSAAALAKDAKSFKEQQNVLASKLDEIFPGAAIHAENNCFVFYSVGEYLHNMIKAAVLIAQAA